MATENFKEAGEIFQNAIEIEDPTERARYLEKGGIHLTQVFLHIVVSLHKQVVR